MSSRAKYQIKKRKSGRFLARVTVHYRDGTVARPAQTFEKRRDAVLWAKYMLGESAKGQLSVSMTLEDLFDEYLATKTHLEEKTLRDYRRAFERLLVTYPRATTSTITGAQLQRFLGGLKTPSGKPVSNRTKKYNAALLLAAFNYAKKQRYIDTVPVIDTPRVPRTTVTAQDVLNRDELKKFLDAAQNNDLYPLILLLATTGLRIGEALALEATDVSQKGLLTVTKTLQNYDRTDAIVKRFPKSESGIREIQLVPRLLEVLPRNQEGRLFPWTYARVTKAIKNVCHEAGVKVVKPHALRHTFCTTMLNEGVPVKTMTSIMGHKDAGFMLNTYAKFLESDLDRVPKAFERIFRHNSGTENGPKWKKLV